MIFISAGFDAHRDDELGQLGLVEADYDWITEQHQGRSPTSTRRAASSRASKAATTSARWRAASPRTCACWPDVLTPLPTPARRRRDDARHRELDELVAALTQPGALAELAVLAGCLVAGLDRRAPDPRPRRGRSARSGSATASSTACCSRCSRSPSPTRRASRSRRRSSRRCSRSRSRSWSRWSSSASACACCAATFPGVRWVRIVERSISWLAWIAVVLWVTGVSPMVLDAMDDVHWKVGSAQMTLRNVVEGAHHRRHRARARALGLGGDREAGCSRAAAATTCRCARSPPTSCARCCCSSACCSRCRRSASTSRRCRCSAARSASASASACRRSPPTTSAASSSSPSAACASATWSRSTPSRAASPTSAPATP